jgi:hypothetical protein
MLDEPQQPEYLYIVPTSAEKQNYKIGKWGGKLSKLRARYKTYYVNCVQDIRVFLCVNSSHLERQLFAIIKPYHISMEIYNALSSDKFLSFCNLFCTGEVKMPAAVPGKVSRSISELDESNSKHSEATDQHMHLECSGCIHKNKNPYCCCLRPGNTITDALAVLDEQLVHVDTKQHQLLINEARDDTTSKELSARDIAYLVLTKYMGVHVDIIKQKFLHNGLQVDKYKRVLREMKEIFSRHTGKTISFGAVCQIKRGTHCNKVDSYMSWVHPDGKKSGCNCFHSLVNRKLGWRGCKHLQVHSKTFAAIEQEANARATEMVDIYEVHKQVQELIGPRN